MSVKTFPCPQYKHAIYLLLNKHSTSKSMVQEDEIERYIYFNANHVCDEIYEACPKLSGHGFSYYDCRIAL